MLGAIIGDDFLFYLRNYGVVLTLGCVFSTPLFSGLYNKYKNRPAGIAVSILILVLSVAYLADASYNPFLYFRF